MTIQFVTASNLRFGFLEAGQVGNPRVLLLHGFPDTATTWDRALPALANAGYHAIAPFMRGYAPTEIPQGKPSTTFDTDTLARDAIALLDAFGGRAILVGHDWGASAAYAAAGLAPEKVRALVTFAIPHPQTMTPTPSLAWKVRHFFTLRRKGAPAKLRANDFAGVDELWRRWSPAWKDIPAAETRDVKRAFAEPGSLEAALGYYKALSPRIPAGHRVPITVPSVAFAGEHDMIAPRLFEKARKKFTASYEVVQVPGGHFMHREHPDVVIPELVRVIGELHQKAPA